MENKTYLKKLFGVASIVLGSFFLIEHIWTWDEIAFFDFFGHEWLGGILIVIGAVLNMNWSLERFSEEIKSIIQKFKK